MVFESFEASLKAFFSGRCQAYTTDVSSLVSIRDKEAPKPGDYVKATETVYHGGESASAVWLPIAND